MYKFSKITNNLKEALDAIYNASFAIAQSDMSEIINEESTFSELVREVKSYLEEEEYCWAFPEISGDENSWRFHYTTVSGNNSVEISYNGEEYLVLYEVYSETPIYRSSIVMSCLKQGFAFEETEEQRKYSDKCLATEINEGDFCDFDLPKYEVEWTITEGFLPTVKSSYISTSTDMAKYIAQNSLCTELVRELAENRLREYETETPFLPTEYSYNESYYNSTYYADAFEQVKSALREVIEF